MTRAREIGLAAEEIEAALDVGRRVRQGAASALDRAAARIGATASGTASAAAEQPARGCCG